MRARKKLDIGWTDIGYGFLAGIAPRSRSLAQENLENLWSENNNALATLSVRSGFDLALQVLALPRGSEIIVSAITIIDMIGIIERHGLHAVPVDIEPHHCSMLIKNLELAITPQTKAILIAHLFGTRMNMSEIIKIAAAHKLFVFEDCAQAFAADTYRGHPETDIALFSFGPIKTATALGGALLTMRDKEICQRAKALQNQYTVQAEKVFLGKIFKYSLIKILTLQLPYSIFVLICSAVGVSHDALISKAVRGFPAGDLLHKLRFQPPYALLSLLKRRISLYTLKQLNHRIVTSTKIAPLLQGITIVGMQAEKHCHWVLPIQSRHPDRLVKYLWELGFDATRGATSLVAVQARSNQVDATNAKQIIKEIVYLPIESTYNHAQLRKLANAVMSFETTNP